jgi:uncharacterized membrane protein YfcA
VSTAELLATAAVIAAAYSVFGLTGFGAAMVAVPVLVQIMPLQFAVPLIMLLDLVSTTLVAVKSRRLVSRRELARLSPFMLAGVFLGATALANLPSRWALIGLGVFVIVMALRSLFSPASASQPLGPGWVVPAGVGGGVFSALFGTGGPIYTMYLARRLPDVDAFRATISAVIFLSALARLVAFGAAGLLQQQDLLRTALWALPFSLAGLGLGAWLRRRVSAAAVKRLLLVFLAVGGCGVILRGLWQGGGGSP